MSTFNKCVCFLANRQLVNEALLNGDNMKLT